MYVSDLYFSQVVPDSLDLETQEPASNAVSLGALWPLSQPAVTSINFDGEVVAILGAIGRLTVDVPNIVFFVDLQAAIWRNICLFRAIGVQGVERQHCHLGQALDKKNLFF